MKSRKQPFIVKYRHLVCLCAFWLLADIAIWWIICGLAFVFGHPAYMHRDDIIVKAVFDWRHLWFPNALWWAGAMVIGNAVPAVMLLWQYLEDRSD